MKNKMISGAFAASALLALAACTPLSGPPDNPGYGPGYGPGAHRAMMGRYGPAGSGPGGPMGGPGYGYGMMGPGMMGGMMGPGTMGYGPLPADLTAEQRRQLAEIHREFRARQWPLMQQMHELMWDEGAPSDEQAQRRAYDKFAALHKQMFENRLAMRKRIDALLTPQQRESLRGGARPPR